ncbi:MAG: TIGR00288 family NYN domain-containing protein [Candidatus Micrarchaeia archaeon]
MARVIEQLKRMVSKTPSQKTVALFVDGPNMLRKELNVDLDKVKRLIERYGKVKIARVFLNQYASDKLIEAVANQGFEVVIIPSDVDVALAVEATQAVFNDKVDIIAIASRDSDFKPVLAKAKEHGKETIVIGAEPDFSVALQNTADVVININK